MYTSKQPFRRADALRAGLVTPYELRKDFRPVFRGVSVHRSVASTLAVRTHAAALLAPEAVVTGYAASGLHGCGWIDDSAQLHLIRAGHWRAPQGITALDVAIDDDEFTIVRGIKVATPARTAFDLARCLPINEALVAIDALCNRTKLKVVDIAEVASRHRGGQRLIRDVLPLVDGGAASPPETHTRLTLIRGGLPKPETQIEFRDQCGNLICALDLGYRDQRVGIDYDGEHHWTDPRQRAWDIERSEFLAHQDWQHVRVSSTLLYKHPGALINRIRQKLDDANPPHQR